MRFLLFLVPAALLAQAPFRPTAQLGVPAQVGGISRVIGSKEVLEVGSLREVTLDSAELALAFPNRLENVIAAAGEKLLILRGSVRNPEKTSVAHLGASEVVGLRMALRNTKTKRVDFIAHYDPETLKPISKQLKGGESARFIGVWRVPADWAEFRIGLSYGNSPIVPTYDLAGKIIPPRSIFLAPDGVNLNLTATAASGSSFEVDGLEVGAARLSQPARIAGTARDPSQPLYVVTLPVTNRLLLPARWGWQYVNAELLHEDGTATKFYPSIVNQATDAEWAGDLDPAATASSQFIFRPGAVKRPRALRLTMVPTGRQVEIGLAR
ncbi:MAG: hypothetical protein HY821_14330 [Acidobacteria bacterium]|nr:hypothetical protein [Acidobacteriota bacterium]